MSHKTLGKKREYNTSPDSDPTAKRRRLEDIYGQSSWASQYSQPPHNNTPRNSRPVIEESGYDFDSYTASQLPSNVPSDLRLVLNRSGNAFGDLCTIHPPHNAPCSSRSLRKGSCPIFIGHPSQPSPSVFARLGPQTVAHQPMQQGVAGLQHKKNTFDHSNSKPKREGESLDAHYHPIKRKCADFELPVKDDQCLHEIANLESRKFTRLLTRRQEELKELLSCKDTTARSTTLTLLVKIFAKVSTLVSNRVPSKSHSHATSTVHLAAKENTKLNGIMRYLIDEDTIGGFYLSLSTYLCQMPIEVSISKRKEFLSVLSDTITFLNVLLDIYPGQASKNLSVIDTCIGTTAQLAQQQIIFQKVSEKAQRLLQKRNEIRTQSYESNCEKPHAQEVSIILPSPEQLQSHEEVMLTLQKNIISGPFPDAPTYLVIQFQLLREDFLRPLRNALRGICNPEDDMEEQSIMMYRNVFFNKGRTFTLSGNAYRISFKTQHKVNWNRSKKLQYGALVCLTKDDFKTVRYATIVERDVKDLSNGITTIQLRGCSQDDEMSLSASTSFSMIESPGYYVAYAPVLHRLHAIEPTELPFKKYLVDLETDIDVPSYLKGIMEPNINLKGIVCACKEPHCEHENVEILSKDKWNALNTPSLDFSQKEALHVALTKEVALIQGPPGTGKTYVGLKLIEALLKNGILWNNALSPYGDIVKCPIVVICYTNHALDQFLEGILRLNSSIQIRRIGRRTQSEAIGNLNLQRFVRMYCREHRIFNPMKSLLERQRLVEAMKEFKDGQFNSENSQLYCYFLSSYVLEDIESVLKIENLPGEESNEHLASWLDPELKRKMGLFYQKRKEKYYESMFGAEDDERREMSTSYSDNPEIHDVFQALSQDGIKKFIEKFGKVESLTERRAQNFIDGIEKAEGHLRLQLFKYYLNELYRRENADLRSRAKEQAKFEEEQLLIKLRCLQKADVIGLTTTAAARDNALITQVQSKILIVEEAAEVLEPQLVAALTKHTQHLVLIGDHKQLRPKTIDHIFGREYKLDISMFERLVMNNFQHATLTVQHRMRPEISEIVSHHIYDGKLSDHESTLKYNSVRGMKFNMFFVDHSHPEEPNPDIKSPSNEHEATFLAALCNYLLQQGYKPCQITVITPYVGQMFMLREKFRKQCISDVHITPIDSYQGEENDIILLSLVRSKRPGFVKDENRICVALSRAKCGLYCIGNFTVFKQCQLWSNILKDVCLKECLHNSLPLQCIRHKNVTLVSCATDFDQASDGGCQQLCNLRLKCNHACQKKCHPSNDIHDLPCLLPCPKRCGSEHRCKRLCFEKCGNCEEPVERIMEICQHKQLVPCYIKPEDWVCQEDCSKLLKCGHICKKKCGEKCTTKCNFFVEKVLSCGHNAQVECHVDIVEGSKRCKHPCGVLLSCEHPCSGTCGRCRQGRLHIPCKEKCTRLLLCGHPCTSACAKNCPPCFKECKYACQHAPCGYKCSKPCPPCSHECNWKCEHFQCKRNCGEMCDRPRCNEKCLKELSCGHPCIGVCGEPCPKICRQCVSSEEFKTKIPLLFGSEHNEDAQFIILEDCDHLIEVTALDHWMDQNNEQDHLAIKWKCCPQCKTPVMKTARYSNISKGVLSDMNKIKEKKLQFLSANERKEMRKHLSSTEFLLSDLHNKGIIRGQLQNRERWNKTVGEFEDFFLHKAYTFYLSASSVLKANKSLQILIQSTQHSERFHSMSKQLSLVLSQANDFLEWIKIQTRTKMLTDQMTIDINAERRRILLLEAMFKSFHAISLQNVKVCDEDRWLLEEIALFKTDGAKIQKLTEESMYERMFQGLQSMPQKYRIPLTIDERKMIIKAIDAKTGSWYKCPNGHYYQIGECGGAMQTSKCPECDAMIGGHNHQLLESNQHAREFDQSRHAAWSEGANLHNFALHDLQ